MNKQVVLTLIGRYEYIRAFSANCIQPITLGMPHAIQKMGKNDFKKNRNFMH